MAVDPVACQFFQRHQASDPANSICCDCEGRKAEWASVSHGTYISIEASGIHRSLGVKTSFVLSTTLDSWKGVHLRMMELGGNRRFQEFMRQHVPEDMPLRKKYLTRAAEWYRQNLKAEAEGSTPPAPIEPGTGHWPIEGTSSQEEILDRVFAAAPGCNSMTSGGISRSTEGLPRPVWVAVLICSLYAAFYDTVATSMLQRWRHFFAAAFSESWNKLPYLPSLPSQGWSCEVSPGSINPDMDRDL